MEGKGREAGMVREGAGREGTWMGREVEERGAERRLGKGDRR